MLFLVLLFFTILVVAVLGGQGQELTDLPQMPHSDDPQERADMRQDRNQYGCAVFAVFVVGAAALALFGLAAAGVGG